MAPLPGTAISDTTRRNPHSRAEDGGDRGYEIQEVSQLTGLAPARLRAWERRYAVIRPVRQPNGYRTYSAQQVALLRAFAKLIKSGERIGDLAQHPIEDVLARAEARAVAGTPHGALLDAVIAFDRDRMEALVAQQVSLRGVRGFAHDVALPLGEEVGDLWALGKIPVAAEHLASEVVVHALKGGIRMARGTGPLCVAACLPGERHEWGFLASLADVQEMGWQVHYLGPDLPAEDIIEAAWKRQARAVALSVSDPETLAPVLPILTQLPGRLPPHAIAVIGGAGTEPYQRVLKSVGFQIGLASFALAANRVQGEDVAG